MRSVYKYNINITQSKLLFFSKRFKYSSILLSNTSINDKYKSFDIIAAFGAYKVLKSSKNSFNRLRKFHASSKDWLFGFLSYELKNEIFNIKSSKKPQYEIPHILFYVPKTIMMLRKGTLEIHSFLSKEKVDKMLNDINNINKVFVKNSSVKMKARESRKEYLKKINLIKNHIQNGDIYEMNYCQEFFNEKASADPISLFSQLNCFSNSPFAVYFNFNNIFLLSASPERFIKKQGEKIISQPIKGTRKRSEDEEKDLMLVNELRNSKKDMSENVMITDLVRNDLSRTSEKASVNVKDLFGIYTFNQVHHMISTITSKLSKSYDFVDVLETTFPMGSMTGAPKLKSLLLIDEYECMSRLLFSSSFGYITPEGDFDFNVIIRSIIYDKLQSYMSLSVGGAITILSNEEEEYEECMIKADSILKLLSDGR